MIWFKKFNNLYILSFGGHDNDFQHLLLYDLANRKWENVGESNEINFNKNDDTSYSKQKFQ